MIQVTTIFIDLPAGWYKLKKKYIQMAGVYSTPFLHPPTRSDGIQVCLCTFFWAYLLCRVHAHRNIVFPGFLAVFFHSPTDFFRGRAAIIIKKTKTPYTRRMHVKNCSLCTMYDGVITYTHTPEIRDICGIPLE